MTEERRDQLKQLMRIKEEKECSDPRPKAQYSLDTRMPHEKKVEIGERILREKILNRT